MKMSYKMMFGLMIVAVVLTAWFFWDKNQRDFNQNYVQSSGAGKYLKVTFRYPRSWIFAEDKKKLESYSQVTIKGPRNKENTYTSAFVLRAAPVKMNGGRFESAGQLKKNYVEHLYQNPKIFKDFATQFLGIEAFDVTAVYTFPATFLKGFNAKPIPVKERSFFFQKDNILYQILYTADEREFEKSAGEFEVLLKSIRFQK